MNLKIKLLICGVFCSLVSLGQSNNPLFKREIKGISGIWHKIELPANIYNHTSNKLSDLRVIGITSANDTIEAPYILKVGGEKDSVKTKSFKIINQSYNGTTFFATFEMPNIDEINEIGLGFDQNNFDWSLKLEGSNSGQDWFMIRDKYRILAIENESTSFKFTSVKFGDSKYKYFRIALNTSVKPDLKDVTLTLLAQDKESPKSIKVKKTSILENKTNKYTEVNIELENRVPLSMIKVKVASAFDYFRPINVEYLADSFKTEKGWKYNYELLSSDVLSSKTSNELKFNAVFAKKLRLKIINENNQPLNILGIEAAGNTYELLVRFTEKGNYYLQYGGNNLETPNYDINHFLSEIPTDVSLLTLGTEQNISQNQKVAPLVSNKWWLWSLMGLVILVLGGFTLKMMKEV